MQQQQQQLPPERPLVPAGYRFDPTAEELIRYYLDPWVLTGAVYPGVVCVADVYAAPPAALTARFRGWGHDDGCWYFLCVARWKNSGGGKAVVTAAGTARRMSRVVQGGGGWHGSTSRKLVVGKRWGGGVVGHRQGFEYRAPGNRKTSWIMEEFGTSVAEAADADGVKVICKVHVSTRGTAAAAASEEEEEEETNNVAVVVYNNDDNEEVVGHNKRARVDDGGGDRSLVPYSPSAAAAAAAVPQPEHYYYYYYGANDKPPSPPQEGEPAPAVPVAWQQQQPASMTTMMEPAGMGVVVDDGGGVGTIDGEEPPEPLAAVAWTVGLPPMDYSGLDVGGLDNEWLENFEFSPGAATDEAEEGTTGSSGPPAPAT